MKRHLLCLFLAVIGYSANAQLVISEISYNPPESGNDSLEYIELFNTTNAAIDLTGYTIRDNNPYILTEGTVPANGYAILAINPNAIQAILGVTAIGIAEIALNNGGETITLENPSGTVVDMVAYDDEGDWPTFEDGTDGGGATIELCDVDSDNNDGNNWGVSMNDTGADVNMLSFLGTPAAANMTSCEFVPDYIVEASSNKFTPKDITINVGESIRWVNIQGTHNVNGTTATYPDNPVSFGNGAAAPAGWTYDFVFDVAGVYDYRCDPHVSLGMVGTVTVVGIIEPEIPTYDIGQINTVNLDGVADSLGTTCRVSGIVHGANLRPSGYQFSIINQNGDGIGIFSGGNLGYTYAEGDLIEVVGTVTQFNGLTQLEVTEVALISSTNALIGPLMVGRLDEGTENIFVELERATIDNASEWLGNGNMSFNVAFTTSNGEPFLVRIDSDTEPFTWTDPFFLDGSEVIIRGIGGQFDSSSPFTEGYQLFPRYISDFIMPLGTNDVSQAEVVLYPNPVGETLQIDSDIVPVGFEVIGLDGKIIFKDDFRNIIDVSSLSSGAYLLRLYFDDGVKTLKFYK